MCVHPSVLYDTIGDCAELYLVVFFKEKFYVSRSAGKADRNL